ncbi:hypothetical protein [Alteromonas macleodii]|uniref:Iota-carrageenase, family GH82 n=1 Tax=Alteromonas macleodii TaxID=28108 RepID=A0A6T9Y3N8_ALTMA|nr:hypothetical protein [Alteromonas macleodii]CAB9494523.1 Iota-carrageenase, family GH82 [Alteromonas macleodii]
MLRLSNYVTIVLFIFICLPTTASPEKLFYKAPTHFGVTKYFVNDYSADNDPKTDDTRLFQRAIDDIWKQGGGKLVVEKGKYSLLNVVLKSNVHIEIEAGTVIFPYLDPTPNNRFLKKAYAIFELTSKYAEPLKSVSIRGLGGDFIVDISTAINKKNRVFFIKNVQNFLISNVEILDDYSKFSAFVLNGEYVGQRILGPKNGEIRNARVLGADYGYGLVQAQLGESILFQNLYGLGGATLRLESHTKNLRDLTKFTPLNNIRANNIKCEKGNAAFMVSPHFVKNGQFNVDNIKAKGCGWAVRTSNGFTTKEEKSLGLYAGSFSAKSTIRNVSAQFGEYYAQIKPKHYRYIPCVLVANIDRKAISKATGKSFVGPSIGVVLLDTDYQSFMGSDEILRSDGFYPEQQLVMGDKTSKDLCKSIPFQNNSNT